MKMTFRWYGESGPVKLEHIRQIPGMSGIVSAIYDVPVGAGGRWTSCKPCARASKAPASRSKWWRASPPTKTSSSANPRATA